MAENPPPGDLRALGRIDKDKVDEVARKRARQAFEEERKKLEEEMVKVLDVQQNQKCPQTQELRSEGPKFAELQKNVQTAPRYGLNGKALILRALAVAQQSQIPETTSRGPQNRGEHRNAACGSQHEKEAHLWRPDTLCDLIPFNECPYVVYVPRSNIPRLVRQSGARTLMGLYLVQILDKNLGILDRDKGLKVVSEVIEVRKAACKAASTHELKIYKQVTSKQGYSQLLSNVKCDEALLPQELLEPVLERYRLMSSDETCSGVDATDVATEIENHEEPTLVRKRKAPDPLFGSDSDSEDDENVCERDHDRNVCQVDHDPNEILIALEDEEVHPSSEQEDPEKQVDVMFENDKVEEHRKNSNTFISKSKASEDPVFARLRKRIQVQVSQFVQAVLEPMYRAKLLSKNVWKQVVRSAVEKIVDKHCASGSLPESADFLISEAEDIRRFIGKLVMHAREVEALATSMASVQESTCDTDFVKAQTRDSESLEGC